MVNPIPVFIRFKDSPRNVFHASKLLDDAQFVFAAEVVADVVIMYLSFIHNYLI